jgi:hypothetical protein
LPGRRDRDAELPGPRRLEDGDDTLTSRRSMTRVFQDKDLVSWEAYVSTGPFGLPARSSVVFNCLSDPSRPARDVIAEDKMIAEETLAELSDGDLRIWLGRSREVD